MKNKIFTLMFASIFALVFLVGGVDGATYIETFENSVLGGTYSDDSFVGDNSVTWNYVDAKNTTTYAINNKGLIFRNESGKVYSNTISNGIGSFSVQLKKASTTIGGVQVELFINSTPKGTSTLFNDTSTQTFSVNDINTTGNIIIELRNVKDQYVALDNIVWTTYSASTPPSTTNISEITECSTTGNPGKLRIKKISFDNQGFSGNVFGKDDVWFLLDEIDFEIEIDNRGDEKIEDIEVQWGVYDTKKGEWMIELEEEKDFDLKSSKSNVLTGSFKINNKMDLDFDELSDGENYVFYVIATGTVDNETSPLTCTYDSKTAELIIDDDFVVLADLNVQETASCGEDVHLTAKVWNIGDDEQDDVLVKIYNKELGINIIKEYSTIDEFEYENLDVLIKIPKDAEEKIYILNFEVYDEDGSIFESDYKDRESRFIRTIKVEGNCKSSISSDAIVTATLTSGGRAGQPMVITSTITNIGDETSTYTINAATYAGWANSVEISPQTLIVASGNSGQVTFTFDIKKEAFGTNNFDIGVLSEEQLVMTQPVSVQIEKSGFSLTGGAISTTTYLITGSIIAVLILIAIVILIIRLIK